MAKLFESKDAMPSGLYGDYEQLTSLEKIRWCADGRLDSDEKVFKIISSWGTFRSHIPAEGNDLVSKSRIKLPLENLMSKKFEWNRVDGNQGPTPTSGGVGAKRSPFAHQEE